MEIEKYWNLLWRKLRTDLKILQPCQHTSPVSSAAKQLRYKIVSNQSECEELAAKYIQQEAEINVLHWLRSRKNEILQVIYYSTMLLCEDTSHYIVIDSDLPESWLWSLSRRAFVSILQICHRCHLSHNILITSFQLSSKATSLYLRLSGCQTISN